MYSNKYSVDRIWIYIFPKQTPPPEIQRRKKISSNIYPDTTTAEKKLWFPHPKKFPPQKTTITATKWNFIHGRYLIHYYMLLNSNHIEPYFQKTNFHPHTKQKKYKISTHQTKQQQQAQQHTKKSSIQNKQSMSSNKTIFIS